MKKEFSIKKLLVIASISLLLSCSKKDSGGPDSNAGGSSNSNTVSIYNMSFTSPAISIKKGVTVTWTNEDAMQHTVTADDNSFTSGSLGLGDTYTHTFNTAGTFMYHCNLHSGMNGSVEVK
jgi:plastocyanin